MMSVSLPSSVPFYIASVMTSYIKNSYSRICVLKNSFFHLTFPASAYCLVLNENLNEDLA